MENKKEITIRKIPLKVLMEVLMEVYETGADFIDITGIHNDNQDVMSISIKAEYYSEEEQDDDDDHVNLDELI